MSTRLPRGPDGVAKQESFRTNCSAAARIPASVAGGSKLKSVRMFRHISQRYSGRVYFLK